MARSPLKAEAFEMGLQGHPDRWFSDYLVRGIRNGFRIGFHGCRENLVSNSRNMASALQHPGEVTSHVVAEQARGWMVRLCSVGEAGAAEVQSSPAGVVTKDNTAGKWRLVQNFSAPEGASTNDGISSELSSLHYMSVDDVVAQVMKKGRGSEIAKMDVKKAFKNIPVHPDDWHLLGLTWDGSVYVSTVLPFGLRSAPLLFTAVADALQWMMEERGVEWLGHYMDDYVTVGSPGSGQCKAHVGIMKDVCEETGAPINPEKDEGPATTITFLGIELDTVKLEVRLPREKLLKLKALLKKWRQKKHCQLRDLQSLVGVLAYASKAVRAGRSFTRRLLDLTKITKNQSRRIRLNVSGRSDIEWWHRYCSGWNGIEMMSMVNRLNPECGHTMVSDASGTWGCGAVFEEQWFQIQWEHWGQTRDWSITVKELLPIVVGAAVWGSMWRGKSVRALCDNMAVVAVIGSGTSKEVEAMHLRRCLAFLEAKHAFHVWAKHLPGVENTLADALSRDRRDQFLSLFPQARREPVHLPGELLNALMVDKVDWQDSKWTRVWSSTSIVA